MVGLLVSCRSEGVEVRFDLLTLEHCDVPFYLYLCHVHLTGLWVISVGFLLQALILVDLSIVSPPKHASASHK
jgi:hypothetical protein